MKTFLMAMALITTGFVAEDANAFSKRFKKRGYSSCNAKYSLISGGGPLIGKTLNKSARLSSKISKKGCYSKCLSLKKVRFDKYPKATRFSCYHGNKKLISVARSFKKKRPSKFSKLKKRPTVVRKVASISLLKVRAKKTMDARKKVWIKSNAFMVTKVAQYAKAKAVLSKYEKSKSKLKRKLIPVFKKAHDKAKQNMLKAKKDNAIKLKSYLSSKKTYDKYNQAK